MSGIPEDTFTHCESVQDIRYKFNMPLFPLYQLKFFLDIVIIKKKGGFVYKARRKPSLPKLTIIGGVRRSGMTSAFKQAVAVAQHNQK